MIAISGELGNIPNQTRLPQSILGPQQSFWQLRLSASLLPCLLKPPCSRIAPKVGQQAKGQLRRDAPFITMCDYEEFLYDCGHSQQRLKSYCHFARNDPNHQCFGVKKLRDVWEQQTVCEACAMRRHHARPQWARQAHSQSIGGQSSPSTNT